MTDQPRIANGIFERTVTRRALIEWLGSGVVAALGWELANACASEAAKPQAHGGEFAFRPGTGDAAVFRDWGVRTVDRQDLAAMLATWRLEVRGLVESPKTFSFADILELPRTDQVTDFHCVEGWSVYDVPWNGIRLSALLAQAEPLPGGTYVNFRTVGEKYNESLPLSVALEPKTLLAYGVAGSTIPFAHGFPLRVVIPRLLGYKNAKYIHCIELAERPLHGFWIKAGYPYAGEVPQERLRQGKY